MVWTYIPENKHLAHLFLQISRGENSLIISKAKEIRHDTYLQRRYHALHIRFPFQTQVDFPKESAICKH